MQSRFDFRSPVTLVLTGVALYIIFGLLWWNNVFMGPERTFNDMLVNNLTTSSVTKNELTTSDQQGSLQRVNLQLGAQNIVRSLATVKSSVGSATTETLATKDATYVRYTSITEAGNKHDYKAITNIWAKAGNDTQSASLKQLFGQSLLDVTVAPVPPIGNVPEAKRAEMLAYIKEENVLTPDYDTVKSQVVNGRKVYAYNVAVKLAPYLRIMQEFSHVYGLTTLDSVSPSDYVSAQPVQLSIAVDKLSHQMVRVSQADTGLNETYTDYGIQRTYVLPSHTITITDLRDRFGKLQ